MATLKALQARIAKLQAQAQAIAKKESSTVVAKIRALMQEHGLSVTDLGNFSSDGKGPSKGVTKVASRKGAGIAKFRDPKSGAEWSGYGRAPGWIANAKNRDRFLIDGNATTAPIANKSPTKPVGNYPRGPQPSKYRDPKSGAEWSGRGKAPSWLAGAKDRTKFLIDGAASTSAEGTKKRAPKAVAAKKTTPTSTAKKGAAKKASATSAKTSAGKSATAKKSTSAAKKGPQAGSKKTPAKKVVAKKAGRASAEKVADSMPPVPSTSMSEVDAVAST